MEENNHSTASDAPIPPENQHDAGAKISKSVNELNDLSISIQAFKNRYDELQNHLNFIEHAIDTRTKELEALGTTTAANVVTDIVPSEPESKPKSIADGEEIEEDQQEEDPEEEEEEEEDPEEEEEEVEEEVEKEEQQEQKEEEKGEPLCLCKTMNSRGLRKYILMHLSETPSLKEKIPVALKKAPEPAKLVFECIGRFYLQGSKAYTTNSPMITARQASILVLEYYLMSGCVESETKMERKLKAEAADAAGAWRKRLVVEGGVAMASEMDARGLTLFLACFGIHGVFRNEDIANLVRLSKPGEISHLLRVSGSLSGRVSGMYCIHAFGNLGYIILIVMLDRFTLHFYCTI